jgi:hypothetical protein
MHDNTKQLAPTMSSANIEILASKCFCWSYGTVTLPNRRAVVEKERYAMQPDTMLAFPTEQQTVVKDKKISLWLTTGCLAPQVPFPIPPYNEKKMSIFSSHMLE